MSTIFNPKLLNYRLTYTILVFFKFFFWFFSFQKMCKRNKILGVAELIKNVQGENNTDDRDNFYGKISLGLERAQQFGQHFLSCNHKKSVCKIMLFFSWVRV